MKPLTTIAAVLLYGAAGNFFLQAEEPVAASSVTAGQTNPSVAATTNLPVITPTGVMTLLGKPQALFTVAETEDDNETSYCLAQGERRAGIRVVAIDTTTNLVTFDNHGVIQKIPIAPAAISAAPVRPGPAAEDVDDENVFRPVVPRNFAGGVTVADFGPRRSVTRTDRRRAGDIPETSVGRPLTPPPGFLPDQPMADRLPFGAVNLNAYQRYVISPNPPPIFPAPNFSDFSSSPRGGTMPISAGSVRP